MFSKEIKARVQNTLAVLVLGALVSIIPFYYNTNAMTNENTQTNQRQDETLLKHESEIREILVNDAVERTETEQIKAALERIESKLDRLIEKQPSTIN